MKSGELADPTHFVGRGSEIAHVQALIHEATLGAGSALLLAGDSGVGKSRFLAECRHVSSAAVVLHGSCGAASLPGSDLMSQLAFALRLPGGQGSSRGKYVCTELVERSKRKTIVILIDDLHLASPDELTAFESLVFLAQAYRIAIVVCFNDRATGPAWTSRPIGQRPYERTQYRRLAPLDDSSMELLVLSLIKAKSKMPCSEELHEILQTAQGNPRFALEMVACTGRSSQGVLPRSAWAAVVAIRNALSKSDFDILSVCSVVGQTFHDSWVIDASQRSRSDVAEALQAATDLGVLVEQGTSPGWFSFRQVAIRKVCYSSLISLKRHVLHERVARHLSTLANDGRHAELVAQHWDALQDHEHAAGWLGSEADSLASRAEFAPAAELYARAATHVPQGSDVWLSLQQRRTRCYRRLGEWTRMIPLLRSMVRVLNENSEPHKVEGILSDLFLALLNDGDRDGAQTIAADIAKLGLTDRYEIATLILSVALCNAGKHQEAARLVGQIDPTKLVGKEAQIRYLVASAELAALHQPLQRSLALVDEAAEISHSLGSVIGLTAKYCVGTEISLRYGDLRSAREYADKAAQTAMAGDGEITLARRMAKQVQIQLSLAAGELTKARDLLHSILGWRDSGSHNESLLFGVGVLVGMRTGDLALVDALFDPALLFKAVSKRDALSCGLLLPGFAEVMQVRGMERDLKHLLSQCVEDRLVDPYGWIQLCAARFGTAECAQLAEKQAELYFRNTVSPLAPAHVALVSATAARRGGNHVAARKFARDAAATFHRLGWRLSEATALELAGDLRAASAVYTLCGAGVESARLAVGQKRKNARAPFSARLTPRELEVTRLLTRKWSNADIARALTISVRTVEHHVEAAFSKLGVRGRWQLTEEWLDGLARVSTADELRPSEDSVECSRFPR